MGDEPEIAETEEVPEHELEALEKREVDLRGAETGEELERVFREHIVNDFEQALNLIRNYQLLIRRLVAPDVHFDEAHTLLAKYRMESVDPIHAVHDPQHGDISTHTTSIPGEAEEITSEVFDAVFEGRHSLPPGKYFVDDENYDPNFKYEITISRDDEPVARSSINLDQDDAPSELQAALRPDAGEIFPPSPSSEFQELAKREGMDAIDQRIEEVEPELAEEVMQQTAARLAADGYVECPICEGTGKAAKGVLKGRTCKRCGGTGMWKQPETFVLVGDEHGNIGIQPTGGQPENE